MSLPLQSQARAPFSVQIQANGTSFASINTVKLNVRVTNLSGKAVELGTLSPGEDIKLLVEHAQGRTMTPRRSPGALLTRARLRRIDPQMYDYVANLFARGFEAAA